MVLSGKKETNINYISIKLKNQIQRKTIRKSTKKTNILKDRPHTKPR